MAAETSNTITLEKIEQQKLTAHSRNIADFMTSIKRIMTAVKDRQAEVVAMLLRLAAESGYTPTAGDSETDPNMKALLNAIEVLEVIADEQGELIGPDIRIDLRKKVNAVDALELFKIGAACLEVWQMIVEGTEGQPYQREAMSGTALASLAKVQLSSGE